MKMYRMPNSNSPWLVAMLLQISSNMASGHAHAASLLDVAYPDTGNLL